MSQKRGEKSCLMPSRRDEVFRGLPKISGRAGADMARRLHRRCLGKGAARGDNEKVFPGAFVRKNRPRVSVNLV